MYDRQRAKKEPPDVVCTREPRPGDHLPDQVLSIANMLLRCQA